MKVALLTNITATTSYPVFKRLCNEDGIELVHAYFYDTIAESRSNPLQTIAKFGIREMNAKVAGLLLDRVGEMLGGAESSKTAYAHARATNLPHSVITSINDPIHRSMISELDTLVVCNCKNILKQPLLSTPGVQFINMHSSLLPAYRGPTPIFWAMYHGESETGMTIHEMTTRIDFGNILAQRAVPLDYSKSVDELAEELYTMSADMLIDVLQGSTQPVSIDNGGLGSYYTYPNSIERREFKRRVADRNSRSLTVGALRGKKVAGTSGETVTRVLTHEQVPADEWNRYVMDHPKGSVCHTQEFIQSMADVAKHEPSGLVAVSEDDRIVAMMVTTRIETISGLASSLTSRSVWHAEPIFDDTDLGVRGLESIVQQHDQNLARRTLFAEIRPMLSDSGERRVLEANGYEFKDYLNYVIDTTADVDTLMSRMGKSARKKIRQSFKRGVAVALDTTHNGIERMYPFLEASYGRSRVPLADIKLFHAALDHFGDEIVQVRIASHEGKDVAAGIALVFKNRFLAWYGGSLRQKGIVPFDCLTWDEIRWCSENGMRWYDFGGAGWPDKEYGPREFKAKFGGALTHFGRYRKVFSPLKTKAAKTCFHLFRRFVAPGTQATNKKPSTESKP